jgi:hypothetical protein
MACNKNKVASSKSKSYPKSKLRVGSSVNTSSQFGTPKVRISFSSRSR